MLQTYVRVHLVLESGPGHDSVPDQAYQSSPAADDAPLQHGQPISAIPGNSLPELHFPVSCSASCATYVQSYVIEYPPEHLH